jgi:diguanylate cyclase (GGDEF)-like protein
VTRGKPLTLQGKIIALLLLFTIATIVVFVTVQLYHEVELINRHKESEAQILSLTVENIWEKISNLDIPEDMKVIMIQKKLNSLEDKKTINGAYILDSFGKVVSKSASRYRVYTADEEDLNVINRLNRQMSVKGDIAVDRQKHEFSFYIPLKTKEGHLLVRLFFSLGAFSDALANIVVSAVIIGIGIAVINIILGGFLSHMVVGPILFFNEAAAKIASGRFDLKVNVKTQDEIEELADTFNYMAAELVKMQQRAENANPLTKLPGNIVIMEEVERRINEGKKFTVIYCDLDNFKAFNDKYGIHKGDDAIKICSNIFKEAAKNKGNPDDFVGHEGGDDFLLLTTPQKAEEMADYIIGEFDKQVRALYNEEDLKVGAIIAHDRDGKVKRFPIMTISLAGVTNKHRPIDTYALVTNIAAEVKKKAKAQEKSCFVVDVRTR